jgi:hypothetical protein
LEVVSQNIYSIKELFDRYVSIGDKMNFGGLNLSGFVKFLKDLNLFEKELKVLNVTMMSSRSPWKSSRNTSGLITPRKAETSVNTNRLKKLKDSDAEIIFNTLCGLKHFELEKTKHLFNRNKGITPKLNDVQFSPKMNSSRKSLAVSSTPLPGKMNFSVFLKSFENIAVKLYPYEDKADAVLTFFSRYIQDALSKGGDSLKRNINEMNANIKRDEMVNNLVKGLGGIFNRDIGNYLSTLYYICR